MTFWICPVATYLEPGNGTAQCHTLRSLHRSALPAMAGLSRVSVDVRCNPDVAPRLTSGGYEDKVYVITQINILFIGGGEF